MNHTLKIVKFNLHDLQEIIVKKYIIFVVGKCYFCQEIFLLVAFKSRFMNIIGLLK